MLDALLLTAALACPALDLGTTMMALNRPGFVEGNPIMGQSKARIVGTKLAVVVPLITWGAKTERKAVKRGIFISTAAANCTAGLVNLGRLR